MLTSGFVRETLKNHCEPNGYKERTMKSFRTVVYTLDQYFGYLSCFFIVANMLIVVYSILMSHFFNSPIAGLTDIVGFVSALNVAFALGYTEKERSFVQIEFVANFFPMILQVIIHVIVGVINMSILTVVLLQFFNYGLSTYASGNVTWVMYLPFYPVAFACCIGFALYLLTTVVHFLDQFIEWRSDKK